jgi:hypothetical protein
MFRSVGKLRYSPHLLGVRADSVSWWLVVDCDPDIGRYYRHLFYLTHYKCQKIQSPAWKEHISVIRNEKPKEEKTYLWKKYDGQDVEFWYSPSVRGDGMFYWLDVDCDCLLDIREELGLSRQPEFPLHLTVGNAKISG